MPDSLVEIGSVNDPGLASYLCCVDGREGGAESTHWHPVIDPSTGQAFAQVPVAEAALVDKALLGAHGALRGWRALAGTQRSERLHALAAALRNQEQASAALLSRESGKPVKAALGEVQSAAALIDYFAQENLRLAGHLPLLGNTREKVLVVREPVGVVVAITPFNYPLSTLVCKIAPALAVGCTVVAKPDEHAPLSALHLARLALAAGFPPGVFNVVTGTGPETGNLLVNHPLPRLIAFTGSTAVGKLIQTASARWVRKTILELGGHCPAIVSADTPWSDILPQIIQQIFKNSGQYCYRISRLLVAAAIYKDFLQALVAMAAALRIGPAHDPAIDLGPLNNAEVLTLVNHQVAAAVSQGARLELGGSPLTAPPCDQGFYYAPTILTNVRSDMTIMQEEIFGPVVMVQPFDAMASAIEQANATPYGLAAYLFTRDLGNALEWAEQLECGSIWINQIHQAYPEAPFGGMKESGLGREKSRYGLEEYTELKTIYLSY